MSKTGLKDDTGKKVGEKEKKKKGFFREHVESILIAVALAFLLRIFVVEAFKIPTGSMAPTLLGQHKYVKCPNCKWKFETDYSVNYIKCSNCFYKIRISDNRRRGGNRILVNKFIYDFSKLKRWDVSVFKYPHSDVTCFSCGYRSEQSMICKKCLANLKKEDFFESKFNWAKKFMHLPQYVKVACKDCNTMEVVSCEQCGSTKLNVDQKNYIKRIVGLPNDKLQIINGDLYIDGKIQRKPAKVQKELLVPVYDSNYPEKQEIVKSWRADDKFWNIKERQLHLTLPKGPGKASYATFGREINDYNDYNRKTGKSITGDIMLKFDVITTGNSGGILVKLEKDESVFEVFIQSKDEKKESYLKISNKIIDRNAEVFIVPEQRYEIEFSNIDKRVVLKINGSEIFSHNYDDDILPLINFTELSKVRIGGANINAVFKNISIFRDVYYTNAGKWGTTQGPVELGEKDYFALGDNSRNSNDSRFWKSVPENSLVGEAFMVFWPPRTIKFVK